MLPLEEEGRLHDPHLREIFFDRVFAYYRWMQLLAESPTPGTVIAFHTAHKLTMMAHSPQHYREMGQLVATAGSLPWEELSDEHPRLLMEGLGVMTSPGKHANVPMATNYRSHLWEQLPPVSAWGETFVATPLETRAAYTLRIVAAEDNTAISVNGAPTFLLHWRQLYQDTCSAAAQIVASAPILVAQYSHGSEDDGTTADPVTCKNVIRSLAMGVMTAGGNRG